MFSSSSWLPSNDKNSYTKCTVLANLTISQISLVQAKKWPAKLASDYLDNKILFQHGRKS